MVDKDVNTFEGNRPLDFTSNESLCEDVRPLAKSDNFGHFGPEDGIHSFIHSAHLLCVTTRLGTCIKPSHGSVICHGNSKINSL